VSAEGTAPSRAPESSLAASYRQWLRLFPRRYRLEREEEIIGVCLETAAPGQRRPRPGEVLALAGLALRTWTRRAVSPDIAVSRNALGLLAVVLPLLTVFPAVISLGLVYITRLNSWQLNALSPGWMVWAVTAALVVFAPPRWARWSGLLATLLYVAGIAALIGDSSYRSAASAIGYLGLQVVALIMIRDPQRVSHGMALLRRGRAVALTAAVGTFAVVYFGVTYLYYFRSFEYQLAWAASITVLVSLVTAGIVMLMKPVGRAVLPLLGAIATLVYSFNDMSKWLVNVGPRPLSFTLPTLTACLGALVPPVVAYVVLRVMVAMANFVAERRRPLAD